MITFAEHAKNDLPAMYLTGHVTAGDGDVAPKGRGAQNAPNLGAASLGESGDELFDGQTAGIPLHFLTKQTAESTRPCEAICKSRVPSAGGSRQHPAPCRHPPITVGCVAVPCLLPAQPPFNHKSCQYADV